MRGPRNRGRGEQGLTLVETLVAFGILFVMSTAVLQLYAMSVNVNLGSLARTDLAYKCERVVETIRWVEALKRDAAIRQVPPPSYVTGYGIDLAANADGSRIDVPTDASNTAWGRSGANVVEPGARYRLSYSVVPNGSFYTVTVEARPNTSGLRYIGAGVATKVVRYVAQIPQ